MFLLINSLKKRRRGVYEIGNVACSRKSSRVVIDRPDYQTLKKQYEDCGKNMRKLATIHNVSDKAVAKWFVKYEKDLGITKSCVKRIKENQL